MKNKSMVLLSLLTVSITQATYMVKVNLVDEITFYQWTNESPLLGSWVNSGAVYDCSNWSPFVETMTIGMSFTQTATDCKQNQTQTAQDREIDTVTSTVRDVGLPYTNTKDIQASDTRLAVGTLETWIAISPNYTEWVNNGALTGCNNWSPAPSTIPNGQGFTQTATDCTQAQTRSRQDLEKETTTNVTRNKGVAVTENQNLTTTSSRTNTGTKAQPECDYKWHNYSDYSNNSYYYLGYDNYFGYGWGTAIYWKGSTIFDNPVNTNLTSVVSGGYRYYMGPLVNAEQSTYQVCRIAI